MNTYHHVHQIIRDAIIFVQSRQCYLSPDFLGIEDFAKEYQTVKLNFGRQVGHTSFIIENAGHKDVIIVPNISIRQYIEPRLQSNCKYSDTKPLVFTEQGMRSDNKIDIVYVDCYSQIKRMDDIYQRYAGTANLFVLLG